MRTLGVDPSSKSTGLALIENFKTVQVDLWRPATKSVHDSLASLHNYLLASPLTCYIDSVCVEKISVTRNMNTVRRISYVEGVALSIAGVLGCMKVEQLNPKQARKIVFGEGDISKREVYERIISSTSIDFLPFDKGGSDQADAAVVGLALQYQAREEILGNDEE